MVFMVGYTAFCGYLLKLDIYDKVASDDEDEGLLKLAGYNGKH